MIDLVNRTLTLDHGPQDITGFVVWWATPWGIMTDLGEAITRCVANDVDPNEVIRALPMAVTESTYEVMR